MDLKAFFEAHPRVAIAFSGGVDSTYLVTAAAQYAQSVHAYTIDSAFVPRFELEGAKALTKRLALLTRSFPLMSCKMKPLSKIRKTAVIFARKPFFPPFGKPPKRRLQSSP